VTIVFPIDEHDQQGALRRSRGRMAAMRDLHCPVDDARVFFENDLCLSCGAGLGFEPTSFRMVSVVDPDGTTSAEWARCANAGLAACNWVVPAADAGALCRSCSLTRTRPPDDDVEAHRWFLDAEAAKRRLVAQLLDLGLPVVGFTEDPEHGLAFDLLSSQLDRVTIGHEDGLITLDLAEADDARRERVRDELGEAYRTVLGHFRHEVGHYYWMVLVRDRNRLEWFRARFGDERVDYGDAVASHYGGDGPTGWEEEHVSAYATMHPWEDWAETFAHYLHIRDSLQTAAETGLRVDVPDGPTVDPSVADVDHGPVRRMVDEWIHLAAALNALNRSMGAHDLYPFVLSPTVIDKLAHVDRVVREAATGRAAGVRR
jgi:hypothetical protein